MVFVVTNNPLVLQLYEIMEQMQRALDYQAMQKWSAREGCHQIRDIPILQRRASEVAKNPLVAGKDQL